MKIIREDKTKKKITIEQFAEEYNLIMRITKYSAERIVARFDYTEIMEDGVLSSEYGEGSSEEAAIADYANQISEKRIVVNAGTVGRKDIEVPPLK